MAKKEPGRGVLVAGRITTSHLAICAFAQFRDDWAPEDAIAAGAWPRRLRRRRRASSSRRMWTSATKSTGSWSLGLDGRLAR